MTSFANALQLVAPALCVFIAGAFGYGGWKALRDGHVEFRGADVQRKDQPTLFLILVLATFMSAGILVYVAANWASLYPG